MPRALVAPTTNDVATIHPDYAKRQEEWVRMRDCVEGDEAIRQSGEEYLPRPSGFRDLGRRGDPMYAAYTQRAQFPEIVKPTVNGMLGVIHRVEAQLELPPEMEYLYEDADGLGMPLEELHRAVTRELLTVGRVALLADAPADGGDPYITRYDAEALVNWATDSSFFVLSEASLVREEFRWTNRDRWRVLRLEDGQVTYQTYDEDKVAVEAEPVPMTASGGAPLAEIPLVVVGAMSMEIKPERPPLIGVANSALTIYRLDADYKHQLYNSGQETFVVSGVEGRAAPRVLGSGVVVALSDPQARAMYVSPTCSGIEAHKTAIADERQNAAALGARVFDTDQKAGVESGEALRIRRGAETASLVSVAISSAGALERSLRAIARWLGLGDDVVEAIVVKPNLSFVKEILSPDAALKLVTMWQSAAISYETLYENLQSGGIASMERTADEEQDLIEEEGGGLGGAPGEEDADDGTEEVQDGENGEVSDDELRETFDDDLLAEAGL